MLIHHVYEGDLSEVERDPRILELVMRQRKQLVELTARHSQDYVILALTVRKELRQEVT